MNVLKVHLNAAASPAGADDIDKNQASRRLAIAQAYGGKMERFKSPVMILLLAIFLAGAQTAFARHWEEPAQTDQGMNVLTFDATLDGAMLGDNDEIAALCPDGFVAGASVVQNMENEGVGLAIWGDDGGQAGRQGFNANEEIAFLVWDHAANEEWPAEPVDIIDGISGGAVEPPLIYTVNTFYVLSLRAFREEGQPNIILPETEHDFGAVRIGRSATWDFAVSNEGRADLTIRGMSFDGDGFSVNFGGEFTLGVGDGRDFTVTFTPEEVADYDVNLTISSNDPDQGEVAIHLIGTGEEPNPPDIALSANERRFGRVMIGDSRNLSLFITNNGDQELVVSDVQVNNGVFTTNFQQQAGIRITGGERSELIITFTPQATGDQEGTLTLASNDPDNREVRVNLYGTGIEAGEAAVVAVTENEHFYGGASVGRSIPWRMVVTNVGGSDLNITGVGSDNNVFRVEFAQNNVRLRPGDYLYVNTWFSPTAEAFYDGHIIVVSDDQAMGELAVPVGGVGIADNGRYFQYYNTGSSHNLLVTAVTLDQRALGPDNEVAVLTTCGLVAGAGVIDQDGRVGVTAWGDDEASDILDGFEEGEALSFKVWDAAARTEAWGTPEFEEGPEEYATNGVSVLRLAAVTGEPEPDIRLSAVEHFFGQVAVGESENWAFRISNQGRGLLHVTDILSDLNEFTTNFDGEFALELGASRDVGVTCTPTAEEDYNGRLTIVSDDPTDSILYVDIFARGVDVVREPEITLSAENHFFGVAMINTDLQYALRISNTGGGLLRVTGVQVQDGGGMFSTDFGNPRNVNPGEGFDLNITFRPGAVNTYQANIAISSDDPNEAVVNFLVEGDGVNEPSHFHHRNTDVSHSILIESAILVFPDHQAPLAPQDEVGVFTQAGLCAGHVVVEEVGAQLGIGAFGNDAGTPVLDGFVANEPLTFVIFDWSTHTEISGGDLNVEYLEGQDVWSPNGFTRINLVGHSEAVEAQIVVGPDPYSFGTVRIGRNAQHAFTIRNIGGVDLTVTGVRPTMNIFTTNFDGQRHVLRPNEEMQVVVTFAPREAQSIETTIIVDCDDPDEPHYPFNVGGSGSDQQGHYDFVISDQNHSILVSTFHMGGAEASVNDEIAVFTPDGICAGSDRVVEVGGGVGIGAIGDDNGTDFVVEGFQNGETMSFKVWDYSQSREYDNLEIEVEEGDLQWENNGWTIISVNVPGVFAISYTYDPGETIPEDSDISVHFEVVNPPGNMNITVDDLNSFSAVGQARFTDNGNNTADFTWHPGFDAAGDYYLDVTATDANNDENSDHAHVHIRVTDVNRDPVVHPLQNDQISFDEDAWRDNDQNWNDDTLTVIADLSQIFTDPDNDVLTFSAVSNIYGNNQSFYHDVRTIQNRKVYRILPGPMHWNGDIRATIRADDRRQMQGFDGDLRRIRSLDAESLISQAETAPVGDALGNADDDPIFRRDRPVDYTFIIRIVPVNDAPVIDQPANANTFSFNFDEDQRGQINFHATDVDNAGDELVWTIEDRDGLPDAAQWTDNRDGSATLVWTPREEDVGNYTPVFRVTDPAGAFDRITAQNIVVRQVNDPPERNDTPLPDFTGDNAFHEDEIQERTPVADLDDYFFDVDSPNLTYSNRSVAAVTTGLGIQIDGATHVLSFLFQADYNTGGNPVDVAIRCTDGAGNVDVVIRVVVTPVNDPPTVIRAINPITRNEGFVNPTNVSDLDQNFRDVDGDSLVFSIPNAPDSAGFRIDPNTHMLSYQASVNFNTAHDGVRNDLPVGVTDTILVVAKDPAGDSVVVAFAFTFRPDLSNVDRPQRGGAGGVPAFELGLPVNNFDISDTTRPVTFAWAPAYSNPFEVDTTRYWFKGWREGQRDTLRVDSLIDTSYTVPLAALLAFVQEDTLHHKYRTAFQWNIWAYDTLRDAIIVTTNGPFRFTTPPLAIRETPEFGPTEYFLSHAYPNPFNNRTTLKFGLSAPGDVNVSVWDMHGRKVADLAGGYHQAGIYELDWTAQGMTSGVYIVRMQAGDFMAMQKAILVR